MNLRKSGKILLYGAAGLLILILLSMLALKLALDRAPQYQAQIKDWVYGQIGYHIGFAHVSPSFRWYGPELYFDRLELRSKDGARVLARAAGGRVAADVWQLIRSGKLLAGRVEIDAPNIVLVRLGPNRFAIASELELGGNDATPGTLDLDDLPAGKLAIRGGLVTIQNWNAALPQLPLRDVKLDLRRDAAGVSLAVSARLPIVLGGSLSVSGAAHGTGELRTLAWNLRARARDISFRGWRALFPDHLGRLDAGTGAFDMAARGQGSELARADLNFNAQGVATQLSDAPSAAFEQISGTVTVTHAGERWTLLGRGMRAQRAGRRDPDSEFDVTWRGGDSGLLDLRARASYLRIDTLLPLMGLLPQKNIRDRLRDIAPTGEWIDTRFEMARAVQSDPWRLQVQARFRGVGFAPVGRAPGLRGLSGMIAGDESGGRVVIDAKSAVLAWPGQFLQPIALATLNTTLYWKRTAEALLVATPGLELTTHDAGLKARMAWLQPTDGSSPVLTLASVVENGNVINTRFYLPRLQIAAPALAWLDRAFVAGHLARADVTIQGPIRQFPFRDGSGIFLARAHLEGLTLDYQAGWPPAQNLDTLAEFRNEGMSARLLSGRLGNLKLDQADAQFPDFKSGELRIHVTGAGDAGDTLGFMRATPLDALAGNAFSFVDAHGALEAKVDLFLPFRQFDQRRILVHVHVNGVTLKHPGLAAVATEISGDADVDGAHVARADVHGRVLGGAFQMTGRAPRNRPVTRTQLEFRGSLSGDALRAALALPSSVALAGQTDWHAVLRMAPEPARERSLRVNSSLVGLESKLPEPLAKPADRSWPTVLDIQWPPSGGVQGRLGLASVLRAAFTTESGADGAHLGRAALMFGSGEPVFSDTQIVNLAGAVARLDLGGWLTLTAPDNKPGAPDKGARPLANYLRTAKLEVGQLDYLGLSFLEVALGLTLNDTGFSVLLGGPNVVGSLRVPGGADAAQPWKLEFERLKFVDAVTAAAADSLAGGPGVGDAGAGMPAADAPAAGTAGIGPMVTGPTAGVAAHTSGVTLPPAGVAGLTTRAAGPPAGASVLTAGVAGPTPSAGGLVTQLSNPRSVPAVNFHAAELTWGERQFGDVRATLSKLDDGISLKELTATGPSTSVTAKGEWRGKEAGLGRLQGALTSTDVGNTLKRLGYAEVIDARTGRMDFDVNWVGPPTAEALGRAVGQVQIALEKGQIVGLSPGAGRVLGLASVAELPRRLALDFSDLTDKGFTFDSAHADFTLRDGNAFTDNVLVKGPAAEIGLIGRVGLKTKDYDQTAVVTGNLGSSPLPLAGFVAGPVVGAAVLVFSQVFKQPLKGLARGYYRITGSWDNPTVERIKSADAAAVTAEPPK